MDGKDMEFYFGQRYPVVVQELGQDEGGGWFAEIEELPGCIAEAATREEVLASIEDSRKLWITTALKRRMRVPLPEPDDADYSGRITLRMPRSLHRRLVDLARRERMSLNQLLLSMVAFRVGAFETETKEVREVVIVVVGDQEEVVLQPATAMLEQWGNMMRRQTPENLFSNMGVIDSGRGQGGVEDWVDTLAFARSGGVLGGGIEGSGKSED
jgi:predicted RNase H-like HicB family nuclease